MSPDIRFFLWVFLIKTWDTPIAAPCPLFLWINDRIKRNTCRCYVLETTSALCLYIRNLFTCSFLFLLLFTFISPSFSWIVTPTNFGECCLVCLVMHGQSMTKPYFTDENRVQIQDLPLLDFLLHIFVHGNEMPRYADLLREIQYHSKVASADSLIVASKLTHLHSWIYSTSRITTWSSNKMTATSSSSTMTMAFTMPWGPSQKRADWRSSWWRCTVSFIAQ